MSDFNITVNGKTLNSADLEGIESIRIGDNFGDVPDKSKELRIGKNFPVEDYSSPEATKSGNESAKYNVRIDKIG